MKIKKNYVLRNVGDTAVVIAVGEEAAKFKGVITLNESALVLWKALSDGAAMGELVKSLTEVYDVTEEKAMDSATKFVEKLRDAGVIEE